ncbi:MAG: DUF1249 domain-containing protein [Chromatiales bacterium]|nr:DUF1249 domain-containing protein [Chromatiales bacterium]
MNAVAVREFLSATVRSDQPSVGRLLDLCEQNYRRVLLLVPDLRLWSGAREPIEDAGVQYTFHVDEQTPYTTALRMICRMATAAGARSRETLEIHLRIYHDARQAEVTFLACDGVLCRAFSAQSPDRRGLRLKWAVNLFLEKWLRWQLARDRRFGDPPPAAA